MSPADEKPASWKPEVFERLYADHPDPWRFETSPYEQAKYADTLAQLEDRRFRSALELGCSIGVLSRMLADRCDRLVGLDLAEAALTQARLRCAGLEHVVLRRAVLPQDWTDPAQYGAFDLVLVSEMLYFLIPDDIDRLARRCVAASLPECTMLLVNWTGPTDTPTTGDEAAERFAASATEGGFRRDTPLRRHGYRLDRLRRTPGPC